MPPKLSAPLSLSPSFLHIQCRNSLGQTKRIIEISHARRRAYATVFGYQQAKSLIYSKHGTLREVLDLHTHSIPPPHSSLITLRTLSSPLNPADINSIQGSYPTSPAFTTSLTTPEPVAVPGSEACLEVVATGSSVKSVKPGDWVIPRATGLGTWRTHLQVDEEAVIRIDKEGLTPAQVATVSVNPVTAWRMLKDIVDLQEGDWFVQNGANSGVGRAAIQLGKLWGLKSIAIIRASPYNLETNMKGQLEALGATKVVTDEEVLKFDFRNQVDQWTDGGREKVRLGLNCVGSAATTKMANILSPGSHLVTYGGMARVPFKVSAKMMIFNDLKVTGFWVSRWAEEHPEEKQWTVEQILALTRSGDFKDPPFVEFPWNWDTPKEELLDAAEGTLNGRRKGKGLFTFGDTGL